MIGSLQGKVIGVFSKKAIIETNGVGYEVATSQPLKIETEVFLWITHIVRENASDLYGFATREEKNIFDMLLGVSGVGPKMALSILESAPPARLLEAIKQNDTDIILSAPGVGKKMAAKIIVELKNKVDKKGEIDLAGISAGGELVDALKTLGYHDTEIRKVIAKIPAGQPIERQISSALSMLGNKS